MIINIMKNKVLAKHCICAKSVLNKALGFIFKTKKDQGIVFIFNIEKKLGFHTFFMRFPIDFLFLDKNKRVIKIIRDVKPWKLNIVGYGKYVVELPAGKSLNTSVNDKISFK